MTTKFIQTSIDSYKARLKYEKERAQSAIENEDLSVAALAIADACQLKGAIAELEFLLEAMETEV